MEFSDNFLFAFGLTLFAGLSTGIGSALAFYAKKTNKTFLAISLGFSGGVMIYVSFVEIFQKARSSLMNEFDELNATLYTTLAFFGGILVILLIDKFIPEMGNPHELRHVEDMKEEPTESKRKLYRMGLFTALAIAIHNFPEGLATFTAAMTDPAIGLSIAIAIAIHNIPEGIAVSVPVYYSTGSKLKAFWLSFLSGLAEPVGAIVGYLLIMPYMNDVTFGVLFAAVAGIMVFISLDELLPTAREFDTGHMTIYGLIAGMAVMASSLLLFM